MKIIFFCIVAIIAVGISAASFAQQSPAEGSAVKTAYDFSFEGADGKPYPISRLKGNVLLVVNTATECGFAGQFRGLQSLYDTYKDKGLVIIGVPSNDFGHQEPRNEAAIVKYTKETFGVSFPFVNKAVVSGENPHPFYAWAAAQNIGGFLNTKPRWNFHKYLIARDGRLIDSFASPTQPNDPKLIKAIEGALANKNQ